MWLHVLIARSHASRSHKLTPHRKRTEAHLRLVGAILDRARVVGRRGRRGRAAVARRLELHHRDDRHEEDHAQHVGHHEPEEAHEQEEVPLPEAYTAKHSTARMRPMLTHYCTC